MKILFNKKNNLRSIVLLAFTHSEISDNINNFECIANNRGYKISQSVIRNYVITDMIDVFVKEIEASDPELVALEVFFKPFLIVSNFVAVYRIEILWAKIVLTNVDNLLSELSMFGKESEKRLLFIEKIMADSELLNINRAILILEGKKMLSNIFFSGLTIESLCEKNYLTEKDFFRDVYVQSEKKIKLDLIFRKLSLQFKELIKKEIVDSEFLSEFDLIVQNQDDLESDFNYVWTAIVEKRNRILLKNILR